MRLAHILNFMFGQDIVATLWQVINSFIWEFSFICLLVIFVFAIFAIISIILAIINGLKKDKVAFFKKFLSNVGLLASVYMILYGVDYFCETEFPVKYELGNIVFRVLGTALAIIGGEYMLTDHRKEE